jgi:predicted enzyme related to lactoylglutathione lyase
VARTVSGDVLADRPLFDASARAREDRQAAPTTRSSAMRVTEIIADLHVTDLEAAKGFYTDYLGLTAEEFDLGWVARYTSPRSGIKIQLMTRDATAPEDPVISVRVDDIDAAYTQARERGYEIVHPLTTEEWGVTRFFVRAPDGNVLNVVQHRG